MSTEFLGTSRHVKKLLGLAGRYAPVDSTLMIIGETGTGKDVLANWIHGNSPRKEKPFLAVNCAALPETLLESEIFGHVKGAFTGADANKAGKFEQADGGTLFLDEVADLSLAAQAKLLRVVENGLITPVGGNKETKVDVRLICATHSDLTQCVVEKKFRQDLLWRLQVLTLEIAPLRERPEDIIVLAQHFLETELEAKGEAGAKHFGEQALHFLRSHNFSGNARELHSMIERAVILTDSAEIVPEQLVASASMDRGPLEKLVESYTKSVVWERYLTMDKDVQVTADSLGVTPKWLRDKLKAWGIK